MNVVASSFMTPRCFPMRALLNTEHSLPTQYLHLCCWMFELQQALQTFEHEHDLAHRSAHSDGQMET